MKGGGMDMNEQLFQYIWQEQSFNTKELKLTSGENLKIIDPGMINRNQGPDFLDAKIRIGDTIWAGPIELHIKASDWFKHFHNEDLNYDLVILHVVWENDLIISEDLPTLILQDRISVLMLNRFNTLMSNRSFIPCQELIKADRSELPLEFTTILIQSRLKRKAAKIIELVSDLNFHWEEVFWRQLARSFGGTVNGEAFFAMASSIPLTILSRHREQIHQLESLLLGQSNLLHENYGDSYLVMLQKEYQFLRKKYGLRPIRQKMQFLRMRPPGFPTIRLAQLAMLLRSQSQLFMLIRDHEDLNAAMSIFDVTANDFWHYHFLLNETGPFQPKRLGWDSICGIFINAVIPLLYAYAEYYRDMELHKRIDKWLRQLPAENNSIIRRFVDLGFCSSSALETQSLYELKSQYCDLKKCLECEIGSRLLGKQAELR
ncbi:MAG: DUF2851 family protein [Flavitalea sp.]